MKLAIKPCVASIHACNTGSGMACTTAYLACNMGEMTPYQLTGYNPYDMRIKCQVPPLCYDMSNVNKWLNNAEVKEALGAKGGWTSCNMLANKLYIADYMKNYHNEIANLLENGLQVLIYAGDVDYICNWLGNKMWVKALEWEGKEAFNAAEDEPWIISTGETAGRLRTYQNFQFLQVYNAGHMVPMDKPQAASEMLNSWLAGSLGAFQGPTAELLD